ncbi:MarR family transcriptional regulator [Clostridium hydrogeniformans]|uniref:MarR family transcriptional regulator n=1 Tax=Clostridium hydrogeniformans TaxID=349933 RepID=UPI00068FE04F|nr:MarR family transcriptional regulator [Clostridium hydrogeniformans]
MNDKLLLEKLIEVFQLFDEYNEKGFKECYDNLNVNEVHTIDYIGSNDFTNVTKITDHLKITKGGVTKITKRLIEGGYIYQYQIEGNKKEKYFNLLDKGETIFKEHKKIHMEAMDEDKKIFEKLNLDEKNTVSKFLDLLKTDLNRKLGSLNKDI